MKAFTCYVGVNFFLIFLQSLILNYRYVLANDNNWGSNVAKKIKSILPISLGVNCSGVNIGLKFGPLDKNFNLPISKCHSKSDHGDESKELTCFECNHSCEKETQKKCDPKYDICVDARYKDGKVDKGCTNEKDYKTVWNDWAESHGGLKEDAQICKENLCNNKKVERKELTCFECNHSCEKETQKKCEPKYDICVAAIYNDGKVDKGCTNEKDYKTVWNDWAESHGGLKEDAQICKENLCNSKKVERKELTCFECNHSCEKETEKKCEPKYDICVAAIYNDGKVDKGCTNEKDYKTVWNDWAESHGGLKEDAQICKENLCNNKTIEHK